MNPRTRLLGVVMVSVLWGAGCACDAGPSPIIVDGGGGNEADAGTGGSGGGGGGATGGGAGGGAVGGGAGGGNDGGVVLQAIGITPTAPSIARATTLQFVASGTYSDGSTADLTSQVTWASATPAVASISSSGLADALTAGTTTITATLGGLSSSTLLAVTAATLTRIEVAPASAWIARGTTQPFSAIGTFSDSTTQDLTAQVIWSSSAMAVATVSNAAGSEGLATALAVGTTQITATLMGTSASASLTVSAAVLQGLAVTPTNPSIASGTGIQFAATGLFSDGTTQDLTTQATWASSDAGVATISNAGAAVGVRPGTSAISASKTGVSGSTTLTVTPAVLTSIAVTPASASIPNGTTQSFVATGTFTDGSTQVLTTGVAWSSSNTMVATISNAAGSEGLSTGIGVGMTTITATRTGISGSAALTVTNATLQSLVVGPPTASITLGATRQFTAIATYSDGSTADLTTQVTWSSSNTSVATISNAAGSEGVATAMGAGTTTITAAFGGRTATATLTVTAGLPTLSSIVVTPANATISPGATRQFTATGTYSDGSTRDLTGLATWASSVTATATISNAALSKGLATGVMAGTTTISATFNGVTGSTGLTVTSASLTSLTVTPVAPRLPAGYRRAFTATGTYSDGSTQDVTGTVTWSSSTASVATISNAAGSKGVATAVNAGTSSISAALSGVTGSTTLTVTAATLSSITVTPAAFTLARLQTRQLTATGTFSDGSTLDVTTQVTWTSSRAQVGQVSATGLVTAFGPGMATLMAAKGAVNGTSVVTVQ